MPILTVTFHDYWHAGTGRGEGPGADALTLKTPAGLPRLPGRSLKGLLREAVEQATAYGWLAHPPVELWFGSSLPARGARDGDGVVDALETGRFQTRPGCLRFGDARLGRGEERHRWESWAAANRELARELFVPLASTKIGEGRVAEEHSLRVAEVVVPLTLHAEVEWASSLPDDRSWVRALATSLPLIRAAGAHRTRGLGRAELALEEEP